MEQFGLLGISPQDIQALRQQEAQKQALQMAQLNPTQLATYGAAMSGQTLGKAFRGMLGRYDPEEAKVMEVNKISSQIQWNNPESMMKAAQELQSRGYQKEAMALMQKAQEVLGKTKTEDPTQKLVEGAKYTTASIAKYRKTGNVEDLVLVEKDKDISYGAETERVAKAMFGKQFKDLTKEEADAVDKRLEQAGVTKAKAGATNVSQVVTNKAAEQFGSKFGSLTGEQAAQVEGKYSAIDYLKEAETMLDQGIYAGQWGPEKMLAAKATGGLFGDMKKVENTEQFLAYVGNIVIPRLTEFGGNDSVEELKYLRSVMAGEQRLEPGSMKAILKRAERNIQRGIERIKRQTEAIGVTGMPLDAGPSRSAVTPKPTQRFNPQTGKLEKVQ